jgi:hypothetical protein
MADAGGESRPWTAGFASCPEQARDSDLTGLVAVLPSLHDVRVAYGFGRLSRLLTAYSAIAVLLHFALLPVFATRWVRRSAGKVAEHRKAAGNRKPAEWRQHSWRRGSVRPGAVTTGAVVNGRLWFVALNGDSASGSRRPPVVSHGLRPAVGLTERIGCAGNRCRAVGRLPEVVNSAVELLVSLLRTLAAFTFGLVWRSQVPAAERVALQARGIDLAEGHACSP